MASEGSLDAAVRAFIDSANAPAQPVSALLESGSANLTALVVALGPCLTHADARQRARGVDLLAEVVRSLSPGRLDPRERSLLSVFLSERLLDSPCIESVVPAIVALTTRHGVAPDDAATLARAIFSEVPVQTFPQGTRNGVFVTLDALVRAHGPHLARSVGADFVFGFVQALDGEKDPRNLMVAFGVARAVASGGFPLDLFAEELFEVTACYFPITFRPPPNDPHGITREGLADALRGALAATDLLAAHVMPLVVEKMAASGAEPKIESLALLAECARSYSPEVLATHHEAVWTALRVEALHGGSVEKEALSTLADIARACDSRLSSGALDALSLFVVPIVEECARHLREPGMKLAQSSANVLGSLASSSLAACTLVYATAIPVVVSVISSAPSSGGAQSAAVDLLVTMLIAGKDAKATAAETHPAALHAASIMPLLLSLLHSDAPAVRRASVAGIIAVEISDSNAVNADAALAELTLLCLDDGDASVRKESLSALCFLATRRPRHVMQAAVPIMLARVRASGADEASQRPMHAVASIARGADMCAAVVPALLEALSDAHTPYALARTSIECLAAIARANAAAPDAVEYLADHVVCPLATRACALVAAGGETPIMETARLCAEITCAASRESQMRLVSHALDIFVDGKTVPHFAPLSPNANKTHARAIPVFSAIVGVVRTDTPIANVAVIILRACDLATALEGPPAVAAAKCAAALVNKLGVADGDAEAWTSASASLDSIVRILHQGTADEARRAIIPLVWLTKALEMRSHALASSATDALFSALLHPAAGAVAADGFGVVMGDAEDLLNKQTHANIRMLYRQRFFLQHLKRLVSGYTSAADGVKGNFLTALSHLLQNVPKQVLLGELPPLVPLLVRSMSHESAQLRLATVKTFYALVFDAPDVVAAHAATIIPLLLARARDADSMHVRVAALECLGAATSLPSHVILPLKHAVTRGLAAAVDDTKRIVRAEAAKCRSQWFMFDAPVAKR